ncbi:hypothetical protein [Agromyces sp. SYSU T00194]|uniref:hypothetical protein n=1 Tax=Agromyces chitinivorans TaxID=3158560 RepID=UPI003391BBAD
MPEYLWSIDGVDLSDHAFNVVQVDDTAAPPLRGDDLVFSRIPGRAFTGRVEDSYSITLGMHVLGQDHGGTTKADWADSFEEHWRALRRLFRPDGGRQFVLGRSWTDDLGSHYAEAMAVAPTAFERRHIGAYQAAITVDLYLADPFFYGAEEVVELDVDTPTVVSNVGDMATTAIVLDFNGQLTNATVTNSTPTPDVWVKLGSSVADADSVSVDVAETTVIRESDSANIIGAVSHSGARAWFGLLRGDNTITLSADAGAGTVDLRFRPLWY